MEPENNLSKPPSGQHIEKRLQSFFPILFELLDGNKLNWTTVAQNLHSKYVEYQERQTKFEEPIEVQISLFTLISSVLNKKPEAMRLLGFIQKLFEELVTDLSKEEKKLIKNSIYGIVTNINADFLNFVGELIALNLLKKRLPLQLIATEAPLNTLKPKGTKIDFKFINNETLKVECIEIVNVRLDDENIASDELIDRLIQQKFKEKLLKKGISEDYKFNLIPVLWGQWDKLKIMEKYYVDRQLTFTHIATPICFVPFTDEDGKPVYRTGTIDTMFHGTTVVG